MKAEIPQNEIKRLEADLLTLRLQGAKNTKGLVASRFKRDGGAQFRKDIREKFSVKASRLSENMRKAGGFKVSVGSGNGFMGMIFKLRASSKMIGVEYFSGTTQPRVAASKAARTRQRKKGLIIKRTKGAQGSKMKSAFVADLNGPKWFTRKNLKDGSRFPLQRVFGPSLYSMYVRQQDRVNGNLAATFEKVVKSVIEYQKQKLTRKNAKR